VVHLLYSSPIQRGEVKVIEDFPPVRNVQVELQLPKSIKRVYSIPGNKKINFTRKGYKVVVRVPEFTMHQGIVLEY
jgi:hypothetical protein